MTDINAMRLKKLVEHFRDDGQATPAIVAGILKALPENTEFLRDYVKAASDEIKDPDIVVSFEKAIVAALKAPDEKPTSAPVSKPAPANVIESTPEAELPTYLAGTKGVTEAEMLGQPVPFEGRVFRYRGADGIAVPLQVLTVKGNTVILERAPEKPTEELVDVLLKGQSVSLNLTLLRTLPAGQDFETPAGTFAVAALLIIADAAKY